MSMKFEIAVEPTIDQLAEAFCDLDSDEQALFLEKCARIGESWGPGKLQMQCRFIGDSVKDTIALLMLEEIVAVAKEGK